METRKSGRRGGSVQDVCMKKKLRKLKRKSFGSTSKGHLKYWKWEGNQRRQVTE